MAKCKCRQCVCVCVLLAGGTHEASWMVGLAERGHHLTLDELLAAETACAVETLVVESADVLALPHEEASLSQVTATHCRDMGHTGHTHTRQQGSSRVSRTDNQSQQ